MLWVEEAINNLSASARVFHPAPLCDSCSCLSPLSSAFCSHQKCLVLPSPSILRAVAPEMLRVWPCPGLDHLACAWPVFDRLLPQSSWLLMKPRVNPPPWILLPAPGFMCSLVPASDAGPGGNVLLRVGQRHSLFPPRVLNPARRQVIPD